MPITVETDLLAEGLLDSLLVMDLANSIEREYGVSINNADISPRNFRTVRALAALVQSRRAGGATPQP
jgi:acyl carrier protein